MKRILLFLQIINVVAITNYIQISLIQDRLADFIVRFSLIFSAVLFAVSVVGIIFFSVTFLKNLDRDISRVSSNASPFRKYLMPNILISIVFVLLTMGLIKDLEILKVCLLSFIQ